MSIQLEKKISPLVENQFPSFYHDEGPNFVAFVKSYYDWMEQEGQSLHGARHLPEYLDVDSSISDFSKYFKSTYLSGIPSQDRIDQSFSIKHIQDLYKAKGTTEAEKLFFRLVFNKEAEIFYPSEHMLRADDGKWRIPIYLEVEYSDKCAGFVGKRIVGATSDANAIVESVVRRNVNARFIDVLYLSNLRGNFSVGEYITTDGNLFDAPKIVGSLTSVSVSDGGFGISNGDVFDISGSSGKDGSIRIVTTVNGNGQVDFRLTDGGSGYNIDDTIVKVSNTVAFHSGNTQNANVSITNFYVDETVVQNAYRFRPTANVFSNTQNVTAYNAGSVLIGTGQVFGVNNFLYVTPVSGSVATATTLVLTADPSINTAVANVVNLSANAVVMAVNSVAIGLSNLTSSFTKGAPIRGVTSNTTAFSTRISTGSNASFAIGAVSNTESFGNGSIGTILSLASISPGTNYDTPPMVSITNPAVTANAKYDYAVTLSNTSGAFVVGQETLSGNTQGSIREIPSTNNLRIRRALYNDTLVANTQLVSYFANGTVSGVGTISSVSPDTAYPAMGNNAIIFRNATSLSGVVAEVEVLDSGLGYEQDEVLTFTSRSNSEVTFTGTAEILRQGKATGFWENNQGKLNSNQYLTDNEYYQDYSYEIQTELSIDKYSDLLKRLMHVSGTALFGKVVKNTGAELRLTSSGTIITITDPGPDPEPEVPEYALIFSEPVNSGYLVFL